MKTILSAFLLICCSLISQAQVYPINACLEDKICMATLACAQNLKFNANGKFKIVQFTDAHYISDDPRSDIAIEPYGRYTGGNTVYNNLSNGARIIELTEGEKGFRTWIRVKNHTEQEVTFPESFLKPNK